jgi:hypothetical protein
MKVLNKRFNWRRLQNINLKYQVINLQKCERHSKPQPNFLKHLLDGSALYDKGKPPNLFGQKFGDGSVKNAVNY